MDLNCRACLQVGSIMISIFEQVEKFEMTLCNLLQIHGGIDIDQNDEFPKYLCENCTQELMSAAEFRKKCKNSQEMLMKVKYKENQSTNLKKTKRIITVDGIVEKVMPLTDAVNAEGYEYKFTMDDCTENLSANSSKEDSKDLAEEIEKLENELFGCEAAEHKCFICGNSFQLSSNLQSHIKSEHKISTFYCTKCNCYFNNDNLFKVHVCRNIKDSVMLKKQRKKDFRCMFCNKKQHSGTNQCHICGNKFKNRSSLVSHHYRHKNQISGSFCHICKKRFSTVSILKAHLQTHNTGKRAFRCSICGCIFAQPFDLNKHLTEHAVERNLQCKYF